MKKFIYILMFMASVVWSLESTISAHVKITNLDGDVLYDTVMVVSDYYKSGESIDFVEYFLRHLEFDSYKDKSFNIEIKEKSAPTLSRLLPFRLSYVASYINGKKHGIEKKYSESGQLRREMPYVNGKRHGIEKVYYESGQLFIEKPYVNGKRHGIEKSYHESGQLEWETPYVNGEAHGIEKVYYESGQLLRETPYVNGKRYGIEKEYNNKGEVISTAKYKNGVLDGYKRCSDGRFGNENLKCY